MSDPLALLVLAGLVTSAALLSVLVLFVFRETRRTQAFDQRLGVPRGRAAAVAPRPEARSRGDGDELSLRAIGLAILRAASVLVPVGASEREKLAVMLNGAGFRQRDAISYFLSAKFAAGGLLGAAAGYFAADSEAVATQSTAVFVLVTLFASLAAFVIGNLMPEYVLRSLVAKRLRRMAGALPDALDLMVMCLESGLTFERALLTVAEELEAIEASLAAEFRQLEAELRVGANRRTVLQEFHERTAVEGMKDMAMTLLQSDRYGTPLTQSMRNIAAGERVQRAARVAAWAERLPVLMTLPMLLFVVPGTMLLVAGPAILTALKALGSLGGGGG